MKNRNDPNYLLAKKLKELLVFPWKPVITDIEGGKKYIKFKSYSTQETFLEKLNGVLTNNPEYKEILQYEDDEYDVSVTLSAKGLDQFVELLAQKTSTNTESENISKAETYNNQEKDITNIGLSITKDLNNFLEDSLQKTNQPVQKNLDTRIADKASFYVKSKQNAEKSTLFFNLDAYRQLCDHNITVLGAAQSFLDNQISIENFLDIQHSNYRWVEGMEPRQLIEEAISNKLKDIIPPENLALSAKMAKKINEYQKNIESEQNSFFEDEDKIELWQHKIDVLQQSQLLLHDNNKFDSAAFENFIKHKHRWAEGKETTALVEEMKRLKGIPEEIIALDTKISRQISTYKRKFEDTYHSYFSFNKQYNLDLWKAKIEILEVAKSVLYDSNQEQTLALFRINVETNWSKGKVAKGLVDEVQKLYDDKKTLTVDSPKFNPNNSLI